MQPLQLFISADSEFIVQKEGGEILMLQFSEKMELLRLKSFYSFNFWDYLHFDHFVGGLPSMANDLLVVVSSPGFWSSFLFLNVWGYFLIRRKTELLIRPWVKNHSLLVNKDVRK
eukprot:TRINITY_DN6426_c0_g1_i4.p1 TRINITY_DN6426_c0_g1~~TRINITY_DN6426_c0_g1_i4.p1  ORF type:complete len:115 (-),score=12.54 TRINITY_DN6426_c0_g1_i4:51-395(-)